MKLDKTFQVYNWVAENEKTISGGNNTIAELCKLAEADLGFKVPPSNFVACCKSREVNYKRLTKIESLKRSYERRVEEATVEKDLYRGYLLTVIDSGAAQSWTLSKIAADFPTDKELVNAIQQKLKAAEAA